MRPHRRGQLVADAETLVILCKAATAAYLAISVLTRGTLPVAARGGRGRVVQVLTQTLANAGTSTWVR